VLEKAPFGEWQVYALEPYRFLTNCRSLAPHPIAPKAGALGTPVRFGMTIS